MKISDDQTDAQFLAELGVTAARHLCAGEFDKLAVRFGYSLAFGRSPESAIREELSASLSKIGASALNPSPIQVPRVSYFEPNDTGLIALVEVTIPTNSTGYVLLELVMTSHVPEKHVVLEQISPVV